MIPLPNVVHVMMVATYRWRVLVNVLPGEPGYWNNPQTRYAEV